MGLNPGESKIALELRQKVLDDQFNGGSPYYGFFHCGYYGVPLEDCIAKCGRNGIAVRAKDIRSYNDGVFKRGVGMVMRGGQLVDVRTIEPSIPFESVKLEDYPKFPVGWTGTERRFFPCTSDNRPMQKWGWTRSFTPELYTRADAKALSPCGWVGQNMLYQKFVVFDIDGRGHGVDDEKVIAFGTQFRDRTFTMEDPAKPGSFHLYFATERIIPVRHFPWAKLDLMGNAVNAAVYLKNKRSNGLPLLELDEEIWQKLIQYVTERNERKR